MSTRTKQEEQIIAEAINNPKRQIKSETIKQNNMKVIQDEVFEILNKYGNTEIGRYKIQLLFDSQTVELKSKCDRIEKSFRTAINTYCYDNPITKKVWYDGAGLTIHEKG